METPIWCIWFIWKAAGSPKHDLNSGGSQSEGHLHRATTHRLRSADLKPRPSVQGTWSALKCLGPSSFSGIQTIQISLNTLKQFWRHEHVSRTLVSPLPETPFAIPGWGMTYDHFRRQSRQRQRNHRMCLASPDHLGHFASFPGCIARPSNFVPLTASEREQRSAPWAKRPE